MGFGSASLVEDTMDTALKHTVLPISFKQCVVVTQAFPGGNMPIHMRWLVMKYMQS